MYIYGAGKVGFDIATLLLENNQNFKAFCVTNSSDNLTSMLGYPICCIQNLCETQKSDAYFIISIGKSKLNNIFDTLNQYGINSDHIFYDSELIQRLLTGEIK